MWAQSLGEYGAASTLVEAFTRLWISGKAWVLQLHPAWLLVPIVLYLLMRRRR